MAGSDWSFSLRKFDPSAFHDSDSEDDANSNLRANPSSTQDSVETFDLSSREENVTYKPNPFSIAKINAACRTKSAKDGDGAAPTKSKKLTGPVRPATTKIVEEKKLVKASGAKPYRQAPTGQNGVKAPSPPRRKMLSKVTTLQQAVRQGPPKVQDIPGALNSSHTLVPTVPVIPSFVPSQAYTIRSIRGDENIAGPPSDPTHTVSLRASGISDCKMVEPFPLPEPLHILCLLM